MRHADEADGAAVAGDADGRAHGLLGADRLDDGVRALAAGEFTHGLDGGLPAFGDDVGGAEGAGDVGADLVAAEGDDALGAEPLGGQHRAQADGSVADDGDRGAGPGARGEGPWWPVPMTSDGVSRAASSRSSEAASLGSFTRVPSEAASLGSFTRVPSANGTRTASPWPPS